MLLYKMELYKMFCRRVVWISEIVMVLLLGFYFFALMGEERSTVEGVTRFGYAAIQEDRRITKEFEGILTDEKLQQIVEKYGFVSQVKSDYGSWWDKNYLTEFVADYFSDGYMRGWDVGEYQIPKQLILIKESKIRENMKREDIYFGYSKGWTKYVEFMQFAGYVLMVWLVIVLSPLFAQEYDTKMYPLIFTTENGYKKDINSKTLAAFTVTLVSFLVIAGSAFAIGGTIYGLDGAQMMWCFETRNWLSALSMLTMAQFTIAYLLLHGLALFMICGFCVLASAISKNNFTSLLIVSGILIAPLVYWLFGGSFFLCVSQPIMMIFADMLVEAMICMPYWFYVYVGVLITMICTFIGREKCGK